MTNHTPRPATARIIAALAAVLTAAAIPAWGQVINEDLKLVARDGAPGDWLGWAVAIENGVVAVGARLDDDYGSSSGSAYLFEAATGAQITKLLPTDGTANAWFGYSIAIDNGVVAVGAPEDDDNGPASGSVYLFDASTGEQIAKILPIDGAQSDDFGLSVALDNGILAVGAPGDDDQGPQSGSAYLFDLSSGTLLTKLHATDGQNGRQFGNTIAIDNGVVAVGTFHGDGSGSVYLFDAATGAQRAKLLPSDGAAFDGFGLSIAIDGGRLAVGSPFDDDSGESSGSAYLFDVFTGTELAKLLPDDGAPFDNFGFSIAMEGDVVAIGARWDADNGNFAGSASLFDASTGAQIGTLLPSDGEALDEFGYSLALENGIVAAGARFDGDNGLESGSAYIFTVPAADCPPDLDGDGLVDTRDFIAFLGAWANGDPLADWDNNGIIDTRDFIAYLGDWAAGC